MRPRSLEDAANIELISKYRIINKLFIAMQNSDAETISQLQALYWREGTAISGPKDISPAYVFLLSRYATSFTAVQRAVQELRMKLSETQHNTKIYF